MNNSYDFLSFLSTISRGDSLLNVDMKDVSRLMNGHDYLTYCVGFSDAGNNGSRAGEIASRLLGQERRYNGLLFYVTGGDDLTLYEVNNAFRELFNVCSGDAEIIFGARIDKEYEGRMRIDAIGVN